mmetsp:Transcript_30792/g.57720  ORF Transcript_30792/g.57720 Transcript_30792/m.57720 type:complete len:225 (-) Transcript_30792:114-788(-)
MAGRYYCYNQNQSGRNHKMPRRKWAPKEYTWRLKNPPSDKPKVPKALREEPKVPQPDETPIETAEVQTGMSLRMLCKSLAAVYASFIQVTQDGQDKLTRFHSKVEPGIGVEQYLLRLATCFECNESCLVMALIYIDRVVKMNPGEVVLNPLTIHRLVAVALVVATKFLDDNFFKNAFYARICGLTLRELNNLEVHFINLLKWKMTAQVSDYSQYLAMVKCINLR